MKTSAVAFVLGVALGGVGVSLDFQTPDERRLRQLSECDHNSHCELTNPEHQEMWRLARKVRGL